MPQNFTNRLCNPTQFTVDFPWHRGIILHIDPDGHLDLPAHIIEDFLADKPGHEAVKSQMNEFGIFVRDTTRPYEHQAIEALEAVIASRNSMYEDAVRNMRRRAAAIGTYDEDAFAETLEQQGFTALKEKIEQYKDRLAKYKKRVKDTPAAVHQRFDPSRTLIFLDPPKEFDSPVAMEIFLDEHPEMREKHNAYLAAQKEDEDGDVTSEAL